MTAPSIGVKGLLVAASPAIVVDAAVNASSDWACFIGKMPDGPSKCVSITDSGGLPSDPKWLLDFPTVSMLVRSSDYLSGYNKMKDIREAVLGIHAPLTIGGDVWRGIVAIGNFAHIGYDPKDRALFSANYRLYVEPAASTTENRLPM